MKTIILFLLVILSTSFYSQGNDDKDTGKSKDSDVIKTLNFVSETFEIADSPKEFGKKKVSDRSPAKLSITIPDTGKINSQIDISIGLSMRGFINALKGKAIGESHKIDILPYIEYHKNTLISKKREYIKNGVMLNAEIGNLLGSLDLWLQYVGIANDSRDYMKDEWGIQISSYIFPSLGLTPETFLHYMLPHFSEINLLDTIIQYNYYPSVGYEYTNLYRTSQTAKKGYIHTFYFGVGADLLIFDGFIQCNGEFQYRQYVKNTTAVTQKYFRLYKFGMNISLLKLGDFKNIEILFGYDYVNGENPWEGFEKQKYSQFSLKFKL